MLVLVKIFLFKKYQNVLRVCWFYAKISLILDTAARNSTTKQTLLSNYAFTKPTISNTKEHLSYWCRCIYVIVDHYKNLYHKCQNTLYNYNLLHNISRHVSKGEAAPPPRFWQIRRRRWAAAARRITTGPPGFLTLGASLIMSLLCQPWKAKNILKQGMR